MTSSGAPLLLVGSYAAADRPGIHAFRFDPTKGALTEAGAFAGVANPSFLAVHPNRRWVYAVSETSTAHDGAPGAVWALRCEREPWALRAVNRQLSGGDWPCHLQLDTTGRWLLASNYGSGSVGVLPVQEDGGLGALTDLVQHSGRGAHPERQEGPHAHSATWAPGDRFVIVADLGTDELAVYEFKAGRLGAHARANTRPGAGPRHCVFHPYGQHLYVANELDSTVAVYAYDAATGALRERQVVDTLPAGAPENLVADIHVAADGRRVYVSNRGHNSLAVFDIEADGRLGLTAIRDCGGQWPRNFTLAPGGRFLLVANQHTDRVSVLPVKSGVEALGAPVAEAGVPRAACVRWLNHD